MTQADMGSCVTNSRLPASGAIETIGNHQQDCRRRETRGHRYDPVDRTRDDLRTPGLKRCITLARHFGGCHNRRRPFKYSSALHISDLGKFAGRCARTSSRDRDSGATQLMADCAAEAQHVGLGYIVHCHARTGLECSQARKKHDLATLARHHLRQHQPG